MTSTATAETIANTKVDNFGTGHYRFDIEAVEPLKLPAYKGSTLRGGLGHALKRIACIQKNHRDCTPCMLGNTCAYGYFFETSPPENSEVLSNLQDVPVPFVIEAFDDQREYVPGDRLTFDIVLVGRAVNFTAHLILAYKELGQLGLGRSRGKYALQRVCSVHPWNDTQQIVYDGIDVYAGQKSAVDWHDVEQRARTYPDDRLTLHFQAPTRLKYQGEYVREPAFHVIIRNLLRRLSSLAYFHCGTLWETDFQAIIAHAESVAIEAADVRWHNWWRYSGRQKQRIDLGGFVGEVEYQGELGPFRSLLALGELVHVGKATVFGHGRYVVR